MKPKKKIGVKKWMKMEKPKNNMSIEVLSKNQTDLDKIKLQKREWYYRNKKSVLKQQKTSEKKKEYLR